MTRSPIPLDRVNVALAVATASVLAAGIIGWGSGSTADPSVAPAPSVSAAPGPDRSDPAEPTGSPSPTSSPKAVRRLANLGHWHVGGPPPTGPNMGEEPCDDGRVIVRLFEQEPEPVIEAVVAGGTVTALQTHKAGHRLGGGGEVGWTREKLLKAYKAKGDERGWTYSEGKMHVYFAKGGGLVSRITVWSGPAGEAAPEFSCE
jgi:hypothetical protein